MTSFVSIRADATTSDVINYEAHSAARLAAKSTCPPSPLSSRDATGQFLLTSAVRSASLGDRWLFTAVEQEQQKEGCLFFASSESPRPASKGAIGFLFPLSESTEKPR